MSLENLLSGFDCMDSRENEVGYNYAGFTKADGSWRILRETVDGTEVRYAVGSHNYEENFIARATQDYKLSNHLPRE